MDDENVEVRVRILLDVDGVLHAVTNTPDPEQWPDWEEAAPNGNHIHYSPSVGRFFRHMAETDHVEIQWLTTWGPMANEELRELLDMPVLDVAGMPPLREDTWWKLEVAKALWEADHVPFVWIDDDLGSNSDDGAAEWIVSLGRYAIGIKPDWRKGLTRRQLDDIEAFVLLRIDTCPVHYTSLPCRETCAAHLLHLPCPTCNTYIAAGL